MRRCLRPFGARAHQESEYLQCRCYRVLRGGQDEVGSVRVLAPMLRRFAVPLRFGSPPEEPIEAYVKRVRDVAKTIKWKMDGCYVEITASVSGKACSLR